MKAFIINKFRGEPRLFDEGLAVICRRTGWTSLGVVPWFERAGDLPAEDVLGLQGTHRERARIRIAVPRLPRIANFDDLDPLRLEPALSVAIVPLDRALPGDTDLVLLPGSKSTIDDLDALRRAGWDGDIAAHVRRGGRVLGICGGYQMLGRRVSDPEGIEGAPRTVAGLGLLDVETVLHGPKITAGFEGRHIASGERVEGYQIHMGRTTGPDCARPLLAMEPGGDRFDGASSEDGRVAGVYVHGMFAVDGFRAAWLKQSLGADSTTAYRASVERALDALADHVAANLDIARLLAIAYGSNHAIDKPISA